MTEGRPLYAGRLDAGCRPSLSVSEISYKLAKSGRQQGGLCREGLEPAKREVYHYISLMRLPGTHFISLWTPRAVNHHMLILIYRLWGTSPGTLIRRGLIEQPMT